MISFDREEVERMAAILRATTKELDARRARIAILNSVVGMFAVAQFGWIGLAVVTFVVTLVSEFLSDTWASFQESRRDREGHK